MSVILTDKIQPRTTGIALTVVGDLDVTGAVSVAGTITYEDVTNIDSLGIITARSGVNVSAGTLTAAEGLNVTAGVTTIAGTSTFAKKTTVNATLEASEGLTVTAGVGTFDCDRVRIVRNAGPILELTTNANTADSSIHLLEGSAGSTTNGGALVYSGANNRLAICCGTTLTTEKISVLRDGYKVGIDSTAPNFQLDVGNSVGSATTIFINATRQMQSLASRAELRLGYSHSGGKAVGYIRLDEAATNSFDGNVSIGVPYNNDSGGSSTQVPIKFKGSSTSDNGNIEIYGTAAGISSVTWDGSANSLIFKDNSYVKFGDGSDLYVSHTGSDSRIINTTGDLKIRSQSLKLETTDAQEYIRCTADADVKLFHDNVQKLITTSTGSSTNGESVADSFGQRSKNSNTGSTNDYYWKIGSYTGNGSEGFIATWIGTAGYSNGQQISGSTTLQVRVTNGTTLEGFYTGESSGGTLAIKDIRWKHEGSGVYSIWVKVGNYGQVSPFVQLFGGTWEAENTSTGSGTAPTSSTAFSTYAYKQVGANATIQYGETSTTFKQNINIDSGKGINFHPQGGSDVNLLDDYESGTWTPTDGSGAGLTFSNVNAWYIKVGDLVTIGGRVKYPTTTDTSQNRISSFPFSPGTDVYTVGSMMVGTVNNPMGNQGAWAGLGQDGRMRTEDASIPYNDDISNSTVYFTTTYRID